VSQAFEWDEAKREANLQKHGFDFADFVFLLAEPHLVLQAKSVSGETRWMVLGQIAGFCVAGMFTRRGDVIRPISLRRARRDERQHYQAVFGSGAD
jgi:uncharacterized protein